MASLPFRLFKGLIYGLLTGTFMGISVYLIAAALSKMVELPLDPGHLLFAFIGLGVAAGVGHEYSSWLEEGKR